MAGTEAVSSAQESSTSAQVESPSAQTETNAADTARFDAELENAGTEGDAQTAAETPEADANADELPDESRRSEIDSWVDEQSDRSGGFLGIGGTSSSEKVVEALEGQSGLNELSPSEQSYLVDRMLNRWESGKGDGMGGAHSVADRIQDKPEIQSVVAERFIERAAEIGQRTANANPDESWQERMFAQSLGNAAVTALAGPSYEPDADLAALGDVLSGLPPETAANFARTLVTDPQMSAIGGSPNLSRSLEALNGAPQTEATSAFVQNVFAHASSADYSAFNSTDPSAQMSQALAREWEPDDPAAQQSEAARLLAMLATPQGLELFSSDRGVPLESRVNALAQIRMDSSITAETLEQSDSLWTNSAIVEPQAQAIAQQYLATRGDDAQILGGTDLDNTIGFAMGFPPALPEGMDPAEAEAAVARGEFSYYGTGDNAEAVKAVTDQIREIAGTADPQVAVLPVMYSSEETGPIQLPLFRVTDESGAERFVDNTGRRYNDFADWEANNKLPPGSMTYPEDGHLTANEDGTAQLKHANTPETVDTFGEHFERFVDGAALVGGVVAGGILIFGTGGLATPIVVGAGAVAVGAGTWGAYRSGSELVDRADHGQSINPFEDDQARNLWLNLGASALSVAAFGSAARLAQLGKAGQAIKPLEASIHGYVQAGAAIVDTAAIANEGVHLATNWNDMSAQERATSILSMGFWATATVAGARASGSSIGDMYNSIAVRDNALRHLAPPVTTDTALPGNAVKIDYDPNTGVVQQIRHGEGANQADIDLHVATAQNIQRSLTLEGQIKSFFTQNGEPPAGTLGWAARHDIEKINTRMQERATELEGGNISEARRTELNEANAVDQQHLDELAEDLQSFMRDPARATIDARNTRYTVEDIQAMRQELPIGETTRTYGNNEATWTVNENHETVEVNAVFREIPPKKNRPAEENALTSAVGREGGRTGGFPQNDNGGHMVGYQFMHDQGLINLFPQNSEFNQQVFTQAETEMRGWVEAGGEVRMQIRTGSETGDGSFAWGGERPSEVELTYEVYNPDTGELVWENYSYFDNEQGQSYRGFENSVANDPDATRKPNGKLDLAAEMRRRLEQ